MTYHFELSDKDIDAIEPKRTGRKPHAPAYPDECEEALRRPGVLFGINIVPTDPKRRAAIYIKVQLRKTFSSMGMLSTGYVIYDRSDICTPDHPHGFIAFKVKA